MMDDEYADLRDVCQCGHEAAEHETACVVDTCSCPFFLLDDDGES